MLHDFVRGYVSIFMVHTYFMHMSTLSAHTPDNREEAESRVFGFSGKIASLFLKSRSVNGAE